MEGIMSSGKSGGYGKKHINKKCDKNKVFLLIFLNKKNNNEQF